MGQEEEGERGWIGAKARMRVPSWCGGPRSLRLNPWPPNLRHTDPQASSIGFCPSAGKRLNAREPPTGPSRATKRGSSLSRVAELNSLWWGCIGGICGQTEECLKHVKMGLEHPDVGIVISGVLDMAAFLKARGRMASAQTVISDVTECPFHLLDCA